MKKGTVVDVYPEGKSAFTGIFLEWIDSSKSSCKVFNITEEIFEDVATADCELLDIQIPFFT